MNVCVKKGDIMSANKLKTLKEYKIKVGDKIFVFRNVALELNPIGKWGLSFEKIQAMMKSVAAMILADKEQVLTFAELEHLANTANMSMAKIADLIKVDRSTITKWKKTNGCLPYTESYCLKDKLPKIIFDFEGRMNNAVGHASYWLNTGDLPRPEVA